MSFMKFKSLTKKKKKMSGKRSREEIQNLLKLGKMRQKRRATKDEMG